jgi:hypothetical protein
MKTEEIMVATEKLRKTGVSTEQANKNLTNYSKGLNMSEEYIKEEYIEEGINGQWTDWKFEAENNKRIYEELLRRINKAIDLLNNEYESCKGALTNPEYTIIPKHNLLKNEINSIKKTIEILKGGINE